MSKYPLQTIRHTLAHVMAYAVQQLWPGVKFGIGPVVQDGFYYDFDAEHKFSEEDFAQIEKRMRHIIQEGLEVQQKHVPIGDAVNDMRQAEQPYKVELLKEIEKGERPAVAQEDIEQQKDGKVSFYTIGGFTDLCKGPHVSNTDELPADAFKLTRVAGAYWRGSEKNPQLQRIYAAAFTTKKELDDYEIMQEEAKKRDHRKLGKELDLFTFSDLVGPGLPIWTVKGTIIKEELERFAKETEARWGYKRITTPHIAKEELFKTSGHFPYYQDDMYPGMKLDDATYYLKAMNCPITMAMVAQKPHSYRELPLRLAEYGTVYRYELSGVLSGLLRVRGFTQNDAHIFCAEEQLEDEFVQVMKLHEYYYRDVFNIQNYYVRLSLRDKSKKDKFGGNNEIWNKAESIIRSAIKRSGVPFQEGIGEASFYGPKADFQIKSVIGREETASTNQIDFVMPARFGLKYTGADGHEHPLVAIHRAPLGSHERFVGFLIEHYAGAFPVWLSPVQVAVLPITDKQNAYAKKVHDELAKAGIRVELNIDNESVGKKIRESELMKIPYLLIIGEKEVKNKKVAVRKRGEGDVGQSNSRAFIKQLSKEIADRS